MAGIGVYAAIRLLGLLGLIAIASARGVDPLDRLHRWDALWFTQVATDGYDTSVTYLANGRPATTSIVFFPVLPVLMRALSLVTPLTPYAAGLVISAIAGAAAAVALGRIGRLVFGTRRAGLALVGLWASWPHAIVLSMAYSEALFVALSAWALLCLARHRWLTAGLLCLAAGATRPTGIALVAAMWVAALWFGARNWHRPRLWWRPVLAGLLAPLGWVGFVVWVGQALGRPDGWFWMQRAAWLSSWDGGRYQVGRIYDTLTGRSLFVYIVCSLIILASLALLVALAVSTAGAVRQAWRERRKGPAEAERPDDADARLRLLLPALVFAGAIVAMVMTTAGYHHSKPRFLLTAFPLLLPLAGALGALPRRTVAGFLAAAAVASAWYGGYLLVVWTGSP